MFVDSGGWIALFSASDAHHGEAEAAFTAAVERKIDLVTTSLVVAEVQRFVLHKVGILAAAVALDRIDRSPSVTIEYPGPTDHRAARRWLERFDDQVITYTDATSFAVMARLRCHDAITFDHDFVLAGFRPWRA